MARGEQITLVGGPADGVSITWQGGGDDLEWRPTEDRELIVARMQGRPPPYKHDPIRYRRSRRTRSMFVYQP